MVRVLRRFLYAARSRTLRCIYFILNVGVAGQAGSVWGWIVVCILIQSVVFGMAELCSSIPSAGGLYYASAVLAPEGWGHFAS
jgi:amino acid transporter